MIKQSVNNLSLIFLKSSPITVHWQLRSGSYNPSAFTSKDDISCLPKGKVIQCGEQCDSIMSGWGGGESTSPPQDLAFVNHKDLKMCTNFT